MDRDEDPVVSINVCGRGGACFGVETSFGKLTLGKGLCVGIIW